MNSKLISSLVCTLTLVSAFGNFACSEDAAIGIQSRGGFANFRQKAKSGEPVHVAFLGGSITQNATGHTAMVPAWLKEKFPEAGFTFTNAGLSSTCSVSGAFRLEDDVFGKGPVDLLIVEFAVNDDQDAAHNRETAIRGLEGIVRQVRNRNPATDIISVHFVNPGMFEKVQDGETPVSIDAHEAVARHYEITSVNVAAALAAKIEEGTMTWQDYGGTHPKKDGYRFASNLITQALWSNWDGEAAAHAAPEALLDPFNFGAGHFVDPQEAAWLGGWKFGQVGKSLLPVGAIRADYLNYKVLRGEETGSTLYFDFRGRAVGAFVLAGPDAGIVETRIDAGEWIRHDLYHKHSKGLNYPRSVLFADELETGYHQLALRISEEKNPDSRGRAVSILFFEVNR